MEQSAQNTWYETFIETLYNRYPKRKLLIKALMELLSLEREAVYRRLRKEVIFTMHEIVTIVSEWSISLDEITRVNSGRVSFQMQKMNYYNPSKSEANYLRYVIQSIHFLKDFPQTEFMHICNTIPRQLLAGYNQLSKFSIFKWYYLHGNEAEVVPFSKIKLSKERLKITAEYFDAIKEVPNSNFIFDQRMFSDLVADIQYFHSIYLITNEEKDLIKKDLFDLLEYLLEVANKGRYPETQNKVNIYISELKIHTGYSYTATPEINICYVHGFDKFEVYSLHSELVSNFITWMQLKKRVSIQISEVDEKSRIEFFTKQRELVESL